MPIGRSPHRKARISLTRECLQKVQSERGRLRNTLVER